MFQQGDSTVDGLKLGTSPGPSIFAARRVPISVSNQWHEPQIAPRSTTCTDSYLGPAGDGPSEGPMTIGTGRIQLALKCQRVESDVKTRYTLLSLGHQHIA